MWGYVVETALIAIAVCVIPGLLISWISGLRTPTSVMCAVPVSVGVYGIAAAVFHPLGISYTSTSVAWFCVLIAVFAALWRGAFYFGRRHRAKNFSLVPESQHVGQPPAIPAASTARRASDFVRLNPAWRPGSISDQRWLLPAVGVAAGAYFIIARTLDAIGRSWGGLENVYQGWDAHWHASVVRFIEETGIASPTAMGILQNTETGHPLYYPTAWHSTAYLIGQYADLTPVASLNVASAVLPGLLFPISAAALAWRVVGTRGLTSQLAAGFAAVLVGVVPVLHWIGYYVGAWPYLAAVAMIGIVVSAFMSVPAVPKRAFATGLAFAGLVQTHPAPATHVVILLLLWWLTRLVWKPSHTPRSWRQGIGYRLRDLGLLAATGLAGALILLPQIIAGSSQTEEVVSFDDSDSLSATRAWETAFEMATRHTDEIGFDSSPLLWVGLAGMVIILIWRGNLWGPLFYVFSLAATVSSMHLFTGAWGDFMALISGLHYNAAHRLIMPVALILVAYAGAAIAVGVRLICLGPVRRLSMLSIVLSTIVGLIAGAALWVAVDNRTDGKLDWPVVNSRDQRMVNKYDLKAWRWLAEQPHAYEHRIFSDPADGSGWMYAYNGLPAFFTHYNWPFAMSDSDTTLLYFHPNLLGVGNFGDPSLRNTVDEAAKDLDVNYIITSPFNFWDFQKTHEEWIPGLDLSPGVTDVYRDHNVTIYVVNEKFTDAEITRMRESGDSPEPLLPVPTKGQKGLAQTAQEINQPYYHRPEATMPEKSHLPQAGGEVRPAPTPVPGDFTPDGIPDNDPPPPDAP